MFAVLASAWCLAFMFCAVWQVAAIICRVTATDLPAAPGALTTAVTMLPRRSLRPAPAGAVAAVSLEPPLVAEAVGKAASFEVNAEASQNPASFDVNAEASERAVPVGLEATLDAGDEPFQLGVVPPSTAPRVSCKDVFVYIVSVAERAPMSSTASLGIGKDGPARFRRPGQRIGDWTLLAISDDWTGHTPNVWLEKDGAVCKAKLAGNPARVHEALSPPPKATRARQRKSRRSRTARPSAPNGSR
jgi:hypothetical protein